MPNWGAPVLVFVVSVLFVVGFWLLMRSIERSGVFSILPQRPPMPPLPSMSNRSKGAVQPVPGKPGVFQLPGVGGVAGQQFKMTNQSETIVRLRSGEQFKLPKPGQEAAIVGFRLEPTADYVLPGTLGRNLMNIGNCVLWKNAGESAGIPYSAIALMDTSARVPEAWIFEMVKGELDHVTKDAVAAAISGVITLHVPLSLADDEIFHFDLYEADNRTVITEAFAQFWLYVKTPVGA